MEQPAEKRRPSNDERIQADLTGYTSTVGQATRAGWDARSVMGVKYVQNHIRPRVGGSVS
jgi:osmotically-inducible protein OsmY